MNASEFYLRLKSIFRRRRLDEDLQDEMAFHLALKQQKLREQGVPEEDLRAASVRQFGNVTLMTEEARGMWSLGSLEIFWNDLRYAGRMLRKAPALTAVIIISLALGIGANTAIYSVLDSVLLKMLPVQDPQELMIVKWAAKSWPERVMSDLEGSSFKDPENGLQSSYSVSQQMFEYIRDHNQVFDSTVASVANIENANVGWNGSARAANVSGVSGDFFQGLRVTPAAGRVFSDADDKPGAPDVAIISYAFWQKYMGGELSAVGKTITVNGTPMTVVGVAPRDFFGIEPGEAPDIWVPDQYLVNAYLRLGEMDLRDPKTWYLEVVGRLKPGVTEAQAAAQVKLLCEQVLNIGSAEVPRDEKTPIFSVASAARGIDGLRRRYSTSLYLLMGMVGLVLLIACANVAGLLLAKATSRRQEIAIRTSLGAPRSRLVRQLMTESVVLALCGGAAGLLVARFARPALVALIETGREANIPAQADTRALLFTAAVSLACGILFGLAPALRSTRGNVNSDLKQTTGKATRHRFLSGKILVSTQVALSLLLLIGSGLLLRTLQRLQHVSLGFDRENLISFRVFPGMNGYKDAQLAGYYDELQRGLQSLPGVRAVALSQLGPVGQGSSSTEGVIAGYGDPGKSLDMYRHKISPGYFSTLGIPIVLGRDFSGQDLEGAPKVAIVNQRFVHDYMHGDNPIGRQFDTGDKRHPRVYTIVGVSGDVKYARIRDEAPSTFYLPYKQEMKTATFMTYFVRTTGDPRAVMGEIQQVALRAGKDVPVVGMKTEDEVIDGSLSVERIFAILSTTFGGLALLLACVGLYGTIGYTVTQRTNEIGVRMALGATRERILAMIVRETMIVVAAGIVIGLPLTWYATQILRAQLFELSPHDANTILWSLAAILLVTALAGLQPARRAAKVDPMVALRYE
jgi:predicted permease